jgi:membrane-associated protease RseP (regulator of RpoE activity)
VIEGRSDPREPRGASVDAAPSLPYAFDTASEWQRIAKIAFGLLAMFAILALVAALLGKIAAAMQLTLVLAVAAVIAWKLRGIAAFGASGTLSRTQVVTHPVSVYGIPMRVPVGTFPITAFQGLRIERRLSSPRTAPMRELADVFLVSKGDAPDIQIYAGDADEGLRLAAAMADQLSLSLVETTPPGVRRFTRSL